MAEFLLELFSEEIPARMQARAAEDLQRLVTDGLAKAGLSFASAKSFVTPRRLVLVVDGLPTAQPDVSEEKRGPRVGAPDQAVQGFLKSAGLDSLDGCEKRDTGKGEFWFAVINKKGRPTVEVLAEIVTQTLADFPWPKSQRWGANEVRWVRPLQSIIALFDGAVVPVAFGPIASGNVTKGHRFLAPDAFSVTSFADYADKLSKAYVILDQDKRRAEILSQVEAVAAKEGLMLKADEGLLAEVTGLVEFPRVLVGRIDDKFMDVPAEVLSTSMRAHQKYFSLLNADGSFAPRFAVVSNMVAEDGGSAIVAGNERVLRARLSDAAFFWETDRKHSLQSRLGKLAERLFYAKLGTMSDKVERIQNLVSELPFLSWEEKTEALVAATLCKADLSTEMVGEFPELQGIMGRYYALNDGVNPVVADAIAEHYSPAGPSDACPREKVSVAVSLADKMDSLVGFFAIDEKPTGSKDPFALRRAALGVIRLILENGLRVNLQPLFVKAHAGFKDLPVGAADTAQALLDFFADRLKVHLKEQGVRHDLVNAVFSLGTEDDLVRLLARVEALRDFVASEDGANLLIAFRRAANIVRIEEKKDGNPHGSSVDASKLDQPEEIALHQRLAEVRPEAAKALKVEDFAGAMAALARLRGPVDAFFDKVTVNAEQPELRINRLRLLNQIVAAMGEVADFSKIEG